MRPVVRVISWIFVVSENTWEVEPRNRTKKHEKSMKELAENSSNSQEPVRCLRIFEVLDGDVLRKIPAAFGIQAAGGDRS
jgi:hypothetical protein